MIIPTLLVAGLSTLPGLTLARPTAEKRWAYQKYFDLQGHRGARGHMIESTLPAFAEGLLSGVTTLELDTGLTKDGHLLVWHDESVDPTKCHDTANATSDPMYPYVGKYLANLTLSQVKTLDCGSKRLDGFPLQLTVPGTKISTLDEFFDFVDCATDEKVLFNIESKVDGDYRNLTRSPEDFVKALGSVWTARGADLIDRVTHQSFDWRALVISKKVLPTVRIAALLDDTTLYKPLRLFPTLESGNMTTHGVGPSNWLAGINVDSFNGSTIPERAAQAAASIGADILSPTHTSYGSLANDPALKGYIPFTTPAMVKIAHAAGMTVKPWTPNRLNIIDYLVNIAKVDGIITDYPRDVRAWAVQQGLKVAPKADVKRVQQCLKKHNQLTRI